MGAERLTDAFCIPTISSSVDGVGTERETIYFLANLLVS